MSTKTWQEEYLLNEVHIKWLSKAKTAVINGEEMTVLPYGYLTQAVKEAITDLRKQDEEELIKMLPIREIKATLDVQRAFDDGIYKAKQLIQDYYAK